MGAKIHHLVRQFKPEIYNLTLDIDKVKMTFRGEVEIEGIKIGRPSKKIVFHQKELKILSAVIIQNGREKKHIEVNRINIHKSYDEVRLHADELMRPGKYTIKLEFKGQISKSMHGIYPCFYKHNSLEKTLIATQFESHHAREAFPCIDEPEAKSVFNLSIIGPKNEIVISNTPINKSVVKADRKTTIFEPSPIMSSYLLAFVIGELHCISGKSKNGVEVNSWANISQPINQLGYANKEAINVLDFFIDYFKTPYPLKKLDQVALPDFDSLAMENWGLITYREVGLLTDPKNRSISSEQLITLVISHEISHQWFGNLVTMKWWDDLWLNESFASLMENIAPDRLHPDWNQWEDFTTGRVLSCSHRDIYKDVQSVGVKVKHPDEIMSLFDPAIVYAKGSRILSMLFEYIGEGDFREGLKVYFKDHAFKNTTRDDLWRSLSSISKKDIGKLMTPWIEQSGQPELSVEFNSSKAHLEQERFLVDGQDKVSIWPIPLLSQPPTKVDILEKKQADIEINGEKPIFNINGSGHYLVKYKDEAMLSDIKSKIIGRNVSSISRITLLNDMLLLARAGEYNLTSLLDIVVSSRQEPRDAVWSMMVRILGQAQVLTDGLIKTESDINKFKRQLASYWFRKLGWLDNPKDDPNTLHLRTTTLALSIAGENKEAIDNALKLFKKHGKVTNLPAEHRALIAGTLVRHGPKSEIDKLLKEYVSSIDPDVKQSITAALCSTKDVNLAKKLIDWGLKPGGTIKQQDIDYWFAYLMRNHYTREVIWQWFVDSWDYLAGLYSGGKHMDYFVWYSAGPISTVSWQKKFIEFFEPKQSITSLKRNILISKSEIETRIKWRNREEKNLVDYFSQLKFH